MKRLSLLVALLATAFAVTTTPSSSKPTHHTPPVTNPSKESECIVGCKCTFVTDFAMRVTRCSRNITLTEASFASRSMNKLNTIEFAGAVINKITDSAFHSLPNIEVISFKNCRIDNFGKKTFDLIGLDRLSFNGCDLNATFPFVNSERIRELVAVKCNLREVPKFGDMPSLETLDLSFNFISKVDKDAFEELDSLETLKLTKNNITFLPPEVFYDNTALANLYLDDNPLKLFTVNDVSPIEFLSLSSCELTTFDRSTTKFLTFVTFLNLSDNKIAFLPNEAFEEMQSLESLDLSRNNLKHLDVNVFRKNKKLEKLILDENHFVTLPPFAISSGSFAISYFSCKHCEIKDLSRDTFKHMPLIRILDLSENYFIRDIEGVLKHVPSLVDLDLSNNSISKITPNTFIDNRNLRTLKLRANALPPLNPKVFSYNKLLSLLDLSNTGLNQIWANTKASLPSIETLYISNNAIHDLNPAELKVTPNLKYIFLEKNKLKCGSNFKQAIKWFNDHRVRRLVEIEDTLRDYIGGNSIKSWRELAKNVCPDDDGPPEKVKEIKQLYLDDPDNDDEEADVLSGDDILKPDDKELSEYYYYYYDDEDTTTKPANTVTPKHGMKKAAPTPKSIQEEFDEYDDLKLGPLEELEFENKYTLTKTSYIVLVTSVFMLTALLVIIITVSFTVLILRKNRNLHLERANLPRFKIPLWSTAPAQKKHSGSVYQTLTEDYSAPKTPIISRYEFKSSPTVHNQSSA